MEISNIAEALAYSPETGEFRWRNDRAHNALAGQLAGWMGGKGYRYILGLRASRIAWALTTGSWPDGIVDHANGCRDDNRWSNLRLATPAENCANAKLRKDNTSGLKGVRKMRGKWQVRVGCGGKHHIGTYATMAEAEAAYAAASLRIYGEFARVA